MAKVDRFEDLDAWKLARVLTGKVYRLSRDGGFARDFGFRDQICRASVSIVSNIAEGFERNSNRAFQQFLSIAKGSAGEVRAQLYVALDLGYIEQEQFDDMMQSVSRISKMLAKLISYIANSGDSGNLQPYNLQPSNFQRKTTERSF